MIFSKQDAGYSSRLGPRSNFLSIVSVGGERWVSVGGGGSRATLQRRGRLLVCSGSRSLHCGEGDLGEPLLYKKEK